MRALAEECISCRISPRGGVSICIMFESSDKLNKFIDKVDFFIDRYIEEFHRWQEDDEIQEVVI